MDFVYPRTIRFADTDAAGVVYFANVLNICHEAYEESLAFSGIQIQDFFTPKIIAFPIVHAYVDFFYPLHCGDQISIHLQSTQLTIDKFEITYEIFQEEKLAAKALTRHVCIDTGSRKKTPLPEYIHNWLIN
ncbi:acyl-CoA thioesterase [Calothrix sp. 336/3]|uniref:acyl-CoA thioesterase n=1 Tax=Calothrix sp. 336/3 TaxID=1337936 RepID=UPI00054D4E8B|nr:thioesterase family protein [Calothrix sp. 336/3]AKG22311.1 1,4-dihydroxy-2-naphthoyl-CoA hydrolase [Calothrix sp. 336/3]